MEWLFGSQKHAVHFGCHVKLGRIQAVCHNWSTDGDDENKPTRFGGAEYRNRSVVPINLRTTIIPFDVHETSKSEDLDTGPLTDAILAERHKGRKSFLQAPGTLSMLNS